MVTDFYKDVKNPIIFLKIHCYELYVNTHDVNMFTNRYTYDFIDEVARLKSYVPHEWNKRYTYAPHVRSAS